MNIFRKNRFSRGFIHPPVVGAGDGLYSHGESLPPYFELWLIRGERAPEYGYSALFGQKSPQGTS